MMTTIIKIFEVLKGIIFIQCPITFKALLIWLIHGKEAANEYRRRCFADFFTKLTTLYVTKTKDIRVQLFKDLSSLTSNISTLRNEGKIKILEIGIGPGANLSFYPVNCNLIAVEYNGFFEKVVIDKMKLYPKMSLDFVNGSATNMETVPSGSVDVVVSTAVLCSIDDVDGVLKEIHRVLAPGGRYYYLEHILEKPNTFIYILQQLFTKLYIWPFFFDGCHFKGLDKILSEETRFCATAKQDLVYIDKKNMDGFWGFPFVRTHVAGIKIK